ncbi:hypothetical protein L1049_008461 [Liquidambar formosana]|uniref:Uncharacterized protein n=1 Tax=Liquidambar formosana TaxID=63359 RepID=A0AAP0S6B9_LIQFO
MSRVGGETISPARPTAGDLPIFDPKKSTELQDLTRQPKRTMSRTLGDLLERVGDAQSAGNTPVHHVLDLNDAVPGPKSFPFVLSFNNLTYSVKTRRDMTFPPWSRRKDPLERSEEMVNGENGSISIVTVIGV